MENLDDIFDTHEKWIAASIDAIRDEAYKRGRADVVRLLHPFVKQYALESFCDEVMELTVSEDGNTWCTKHCNGFCGECVTKWLELKEK